MYKVKIINKTMELSECAKNWFFDEKYNCWCLEDIIYTPVATVPKFQRMSIFAPADCMSEPGVFTEKAKETPIIFENNSAAYRQMPHVWLDGPRCYAQQYLERGYVYVSAGNRGYDSKDADGRFAGKSPENLIDLKTVIRFLKHNKAAVPGDTEKIISVGWSAGGAMSVLLGVTGDHPDFDEYLQKNGAFMDESDAIYATQVYCPIVDLEHADMAYEWMYREDEQNEASHCGPEGTMTPFERTLSYEMAKRYIPYFNSLQLKHPETGEVLTLGIDGRSGGAYDYLVELIGKSFTKFLTKLEAGELEHPYTVEDYMNGNYQAFKRIPPTAKKKLVTEEEAAPKKEPPSFGDLLSRPEDGSEYVPTANPIMQPIPGDPASVWAYWDGKTATLKNLDAYILNHRRRMKPVMSFDVLSMKAAECHLFGTNEKPETRFSFGTADALEAIREEFPKEVEKYYASYNETLEDEDRLRRIYLLNPMNFIQDERSKKCENFRIRVGAKDADTSFTISMALALKLAEAGKEVDYQLVWDQPHSEADYKGEIFEWIEAIL